MGVMPSARQVTPISGTGPSDPVRLFSVLGVNWMVHESLEPCDCRTTRVLVFASDEAIRCVRGYPANWYELTDEDLNSVSWNR
jgi:hypothetical protein